MFNRIPTLNEAEIEILEGEDLNAFLQDLVRLDQDNHFDHPVTMLSLAAPTVTADSATVEVQNFK